MASVKVHGGEADAGPSSLIASDRVEGTPVRRSNGETLGTIDKLVIEKRSGRVAYAILSAGGFLGVGEEHVAVPWGKLRYDTGLDAYQVDMTDDEIRGAPRRARGEGRDLSQDPSFDPEWERHVHNYFQAQPHPNVGIKSASDQG